LKELDPYEGNHYNEPVDEDAQSSRVENIYKVTGHREDYINPTIDGELSRGVSNIMTQILMMP
jgi:hypothetical protein